MNVMLYREGVGTRIWGKQYKTMIVSEDDVASHLSDGWFKHPDEVRAKPVETAKVKRTRKANAEAEPQEEVSDESDNEG